MKINKKLIIICLILFLAMGVASASDANQTTDDVVSAPADNVKHVEINDTVEVSADDHVDRDVLSSKGVDDISEDAIVSEGKQVSEKEVLGASGDEDVLGDTYYDSSYSTMNNRFDRLSTQISSAANRDKDVVLTMNYTSNPVDTGVVVYNPSITGMPSSGKYILMQVGNNAGGSLDRTMHIMEGVTTKISNIYFKYGRRDTGSQGGQVMIEKNAKVTFVNCVFDSARQCNAGGSIYADSNVTVEFINCTFTENELYEHNHPTTTYGGSALYMKDAAGAKFTNVTFIDNNAPRGTATIYFAGVSSNVNYDNCTFINNKAELTTTSNAATSIARNGQGAVIYFETPISNMNVTNCKFIDNSAARAGGAIYFQAGCANISIVNTTLSGNKIKSQEGGALYFGDDCSNISIINVTFENNQAATSGGAIYIAGNIENFLVNGSTFINNTAANGDGGAIYIAEGKNVTVDNSTFKDNKATAGEGGAIYWGSKDNFETKDTTFEGNEAKNGATIQFKQALDKISFRDTEFIKNKNSAGTGSALHISDNSGAETVEIINCTFVNNTVPTDGAAVHIPASVKNVYVDNCSFINNSAGRYGGALYLEISDSFKIYNSNFTLNKAQKGATVYIKNAIDEIVFENIRFESNTVTNGNGGGVEIPNGSGDVTFKNCTFTGNDASGDGGALYIPSNLNSLTITNTDYFVNNTADGNGGAIYWGIGNDFIVNDYTFINNTAAKGATVYFAQNIDNVGFTNTKFINNTVTNGNGGGISFENVACPTINNCTFTGNDASGDGGAIYMPSGITAYSLTKTNKFTDNHADGNGGAIYWGTTLDINIDDYTFINNSANNGGAFYYVHALSDKVFTNVTFINNTANTNGGGLYLPSACNKIEVKDSNFTGNNATTGKGGALYFNGNSNHITIDNTLFDDNTANTGGAINFYTAGNGYSDIDIVKSNFTNNRATTKTATSGGSAIAFDTVSDVDIDHCIFDNNVATASGAITFNDFNDIYFNECNFTHNTAGNYSGAVYYNRDTINGNSTFMLCNFDNNKALYNDGGAVYSVGDNVTVINNTFTNNHAYYGGAFTSYTSSYTNGNKILNIINSTFINNTAFRGGAVDVFRTQNAHIVNCIFEDNNASDYGGAVWMDGMRGLITKSNFTNNNAKDASAISYKPLSLNDIPETKANITYCIFTKNNATGSGTVWFESSSGRLENCNFTDNVAGIAAGVYVNIGGVHIANSNFTGNNATDTAGAIYLTAASTSEEAGSSYVEYCNFVNNAAENYAGAIYSLSSGGVIQHCNFTNNTADNGGALVLGSDGQNVIDCSFKSNNATSGNGGAILISNSESHTIKDSTFENNYAYNGGAIYNPGKDLASVTIDNDTFIDNIAKYNGGALYVGIKNGAEIYRDYNMFDNQAVESSGLTDRVDWTSKYNEEIIKNSLFKGNKDYLFEVGSRVVGFMGYVTVTLPEYVNKAYADNPSNNVVIKVIINNESGDKFGEYTYSASDDLWSWNENVVTLGLLFTEEQEGTYNASASFSDNNHLLKSNNTVFVIEDTSKGPFTLLQEAIDKAIREGKDVYEIEESVTYLPGYDHGQINITSPIKIIGKGVVTLNSEGYCRIFDIRAPNVVIENIRFVNGNASGEQSTSHDKSNGGAILWEGVNGQIINCNFTDNWAVNGGAVFVQNNGTQGKIINSTFEKNIARENGGAVDWNSTGGNVTNSRFIENSAKLGGAVYVGSNSTSSYLTKSNFTKNVASERGGAIDWYASNGDVENSRFVENSAPYGGAIFVGHKTTSGKLINSTFIKNTADFNGGAVDWNSTGGIVIGSEFYNNTANLGGAIYVGSNSSSGNITNSVFEYNSAVRGGAVDWYASAGNIISSNFTSNNAEYGGAVFIGTQAYDSNITSSRFVSNKATQNGGAVDWNATKGNLKDSYFEKNSALYGGAIFRGANGTEGVGYNNIFVANHADINGGAIDWNASNGRVNKSYFYNNTAGQNGGAVFVGANSTESHIYDSVFEGNNATGRGGAVDWYAASGEIKNSNFTKNNAEFGGAVFVGHATTGGNITGSRFTLNTATKNGGAIDWNASAGHVISSVFENNVAKQGNGGAVFVGANSTTSYIVKSNFTSNNATNGRGGAIDWYASTGIVNESRFENNHAQLGGAIFVGTQSEDGQIINSVFNKNGATDKGGAVDWNSTGGKIIDSTFSENTAQYGGAVFVGAGSQSANITKSTFNDNEASISGGAVYFNQVKDGDIANSKFESNKAYNGGAVYVEECLDMKITDSNFTQNSATLRGADICVDESNATLLYNLKISNSLNTESVCVDSNVTIDKVNMSSWATNAILFTGINSTLSNSVLNGNQAIMIDSDANVTLTKNNITGSGNYAVYNNGNLTLSGNKFADVILNNGNILSKTVTVVLNNDTLVVKLGEDAVLNVTIYDDNNNTIIPVNDFGLYANATNIDVVREGKYLKGNYTNPARGVYTITAKTTGLLNNELKNGTLEVKADSTIKVEVTEQINEGEKVVITATVGPEGATGNVTFIVNGEDKGTVKVENGIAKLNLTDLPAAFYYVTAKYNGDDLDYPSENQTTFTVKMRDPTFNIEVKNILTGQNATVVVTTNATGSVLIIVNGKPEEVQIKDGKAILNVTGLANGTYNASATYFGGNQFNRASNSTLFNVSEMSVKADDINNGEDAVIVITIPESITDGLKVYVDGVERTPVVYNRGNATVTVAGLGLGNHTVNVTYTGSAYNYNEVNGTVFNVKPATNYTFDVNVTEGKYGENTTISVEIPQGISSVNLTIDGENYTITVDPATGKGVFNISNLTAGDHKIVVSYAGDDNYAPKEIVKEINIDKAESKLNVTVENNKPGENVTVKVDVGKNATGVVSIIINGEQHPVEVDENGTATYIIENALPGEYNVTAKFYGDDNYEKVSSAEPYTFTVDKIESEVTISNITVADNNTVTVEVNVSPSDATGTVNVTIDGKNYTADVKDGVAKVIVDDLDINTTTSFNVTYSGDEMYDGKTISSDKNITVGRLNNLTVDVKVTPGQYGENTTVEVTVPEGVDGDIAVIGEDGKSYPVTYNETTGKYIAVVPPQAVGDHNITVKVENSSLYEDKEFKYNFTVDKNDNYSIDVNITKGAYGENTTIEVTAPAGISVVNLTIDGENYTININETTGKGVFNISNLTAGKHEVVVSYPGDGNFEPKSTTEIIDIPKAVSEMAVEVTGGEPGENVTVKVNVGPNATGLVVVNINGEKHYVDVDENGTATYVIENAEPGEYNITAEFTGDDNYAKASSEKYNITVEKYEAEINIGEPIVGPDNNVTVVVEIVPGDATGNVTVTLENGTNITVPVVDGKANVPVGILPVNGTMAYNVTYSGDKKYANKTVVSDKDIEVGQLTNYTADIKVIPGQFGENTTVIVDVPSVDDGNITVKVDNVSYPVTKLENGTYVAQIPPTSVGTHNVTVELVNSSKYGNKQFNETFNVTANDHYDVNITITPENPKFGENITIEVEIPEGMDNVTVNIDGENITVSVDPTTGKGKLVLDNLTAGNHTITVITPGNGNYTPKVNTTKLTVDKAESEMDINITGGKAGENVTVKVNVGPNATGYVVVTVNGEEHVVPVDENGTATYVVPNAQPGELNITTEYLGDDNYAPVKNNKSFTVDKFPVDVTIEDINITDDNNVTFVVKVNATDASGNVTVTLADGTTKTVPVVNGEAKVNLGVLPVGKDTTYNVTYSGDDKYEGKTIESTENLTVGKLNNFTADVEVIPGQYGENTTVKVNVPEDATGNITVTVDGVDYPVTKDENGTYIAQIPPQSVGNHTIEVSLTNDPNYNDTVIVKNLTTEPNDHYDVNVTVTPGSFGNDTVIEVEIPEGMDNVTVNIDGKNITVLVDPTTGKGKLVLDNLTAGNHTITVITPGNGNYTPKSSEPQVVNIPQAVSDMDINITGGEPGENITVTVNVGPNATGHVVVTINGEEHIVPVDENGTAKYVIPNAQPGDVNITAEFLGDDNYAPVKNNKTVTVPKFESELEILEPVIEDNNNVTIIVKVNPEDATGNVTVTLADGTNKTVPVVNGEAKVNLGVLPVGENTAFNVTYSGDDKYNKSSKASEENLTVGKLNNMTVDVKVTPGQYGENTTVEVTVPEDVEGDIAVIGDDGKTYPVTYNETTGKYIAVVPPQAVGNHNITVKVENSSLYEDKEFKYNFTVDKNDNYSIDVNITKGAYGENTTIEVTAPAGIAVVNLTIDGQNYTININETTGKGVFNISNLTAGKHEVVVSYPGDGNFEPKSTTEFIDIPKAVSEMAVEVTGGEPGENVTVKVNVGPNATGLVVVNINGEKHYVDVDENGTATYVIENAEPGEYNITAEFTGDDNYAKASSEKYNITVDKYDSTVTIEEPVIEDNNNVTIIVDIDPADATGNVTITFADGTNKTVPVKDGKAEINLGVLPVGKDTSYNVTYSGDDKYEGKTIVSDKNLTVGKLNNFTADVEVIPGQFGENTTVKVNVPEDATGNITVTVDGVDYPVTKDENGTYIAQIPPQSVGNHTIEVSLTNDPNYNDTVIVKNLTTEPNDHYDVNVTVTPGSFGNDTIIEVEIPEGMDNVTVNIDGKNITVPVDPATGKGKLVLDNLTAGNHTITVITPGSGNYTPKSSEPQVVNIPQAVSDMDINITGGKAGEDVVVKVDVGPNATGYVVVTVNGEEHVVPVDENGTATYTIPNAQPGELNITTEYLGDDNYAPVKNNETFTVDKFPVSMEVLDPVITPDNNVTVVVKVNATDATGNVTIKLENGTEITVPVENGEARVNIGIVPPNTTPVMNITYSGDDKYNSTELTSVDSVEVGPLNNFTADIEVIPGQFGENTTVKVTVPEDATGNITVTVDGVPYPVTKDENGTYIAVIPPTSVGNHTVKVSITNDTRYNDTEILRNLTTEPNDHYDVNITVTPGRFGENTTVEVEIPEGMDNVTVNIDGKNITVPVDPETGKGKLVLDNLTAGNHTITVITPGSGNYTPRTNTTTVNIPQAVSDMDINITGGKAGEDVVVKVDVGPNATGYVVVTINGEEHVVPVDENGTATYTIPNAQPGELNITTEYLGDDNYAPVKNNETFTVDKFPVSMEVLEPIITPDNNVTVVVKVNATDATGNVTIKLENGTEITVPVENGEARVNIGIVPPNTTPVMNITYSGDDKYNSTELTSVDSVEVGPLNNFTADVEIIPGQFGENTTVKVTVPEDATGNITVTVDGVDYPVTKDENGTYIAVIPPQSVGNHTVKVSITNDTRYNDTEIVKNLTTEPNDHYDVNITITPVPPKYGDNITISVDAPEGIDEINITVDGKNITVPVDPATGKGELTLNNLTGGSHEIIANIPGNENYTAKTNKTVFDVEPATPEVNVEITPGHVGEPSVVNITLPEDAGGYVVIDVNGTKYYQPVVNGSAIVEIPELGYGDHDLNITYVGDGNYAPVNVEDTLSVPKNNVTMNVSVSEPRVGENTVVTVDLPEGVYGTVTIQIGNITKTVAVTGGTNEIIIPDVPAGEHDVIVTFDENEKFAPVTETSKVNVLPAETTADDIKLEDSGNGTIKITVPENATGNVTIKIDNETFTIPVVNGTATFNLTNLTNLTPGVHNVTVTYSGDENHTAYSYNTTVTIPKWKSGVTIKGVNIRQGDDETLTIEVDGEDVTGTVHVDIDGVGYYANLTDGKATVIVDGLKKGKYVAKVAYLGDDHYLPVENTTEVYVDTPITLDIGGEGNNSEIVVNVPEDTKGNVTVLIDGEPYAAVVDANGTVKIPLENITPGDHNVTVIYEDANGTKSTVSEILSVPKWNSQLSATSIDIKVGEDETIKITGPKGINGHAAVKLDGINYYVNLTDGEGTIDISKLAEGNYTAQVIYLENDMYLESSTNTSFEVSKVDLKPNETNVDIKDEQNGTINVEVTLPDDATGTITVNVDGVNYTYPAHGGLNNISIDNLPKGDHNVTVTYSGDDKYDNFTVSKNITVTKKPIATVIVVDKEFTRLATDYYAGERGGMFYGILMDTDGNLLANKVVQVAINGPVYNVTTDEWGRIPMQINLMNKNVYTYALFFQGDETYNATHIASSKLTVQAKDTSIVASSVKFKASAKNKVVKVTLKTVKNPYDGKTYLKAGKKITLKVNGKTYTGKINKKGVVKFNVKLTKKGKYTAKIKFAGDKTYNGSSKKIKITIK